MTTPPLRIFSDTASTSTVDPKPLAELDFSDVDLLLEGDTPVVSIEGLESKVKQQVGQILATAATALSADWTAIYLLDDETQNLILIDQCSQSDRFQQADEIRNLKYSTADLEALTGHVVMLESSQRMEYWNAPVNARAGICVPLISNDIPMGTLWFSFENELEATQHRSALCEVIADRVVDYLTHRLAPSNSQKHSEMADLAKRWQHSRLAQTHFKIDGWDIQGWINPEAAGTSFVLRLAIRSPRCGYFYCSGSGLKYRSRINSSRNPNWCPSHFPEFLSPADTLERVNEYLWRGCTGDQFADLCQISLDKNSPQVSSHL